MNRVPRSFIANVSEHSCSSCQYFPFVLAIKLTHTLRLYTDGKLPYDWPEPYPLKGGADRDSRYVALEIEHGRR